MVHSEFDCVLTPPPPNVCVIFVFKAPISDIRDAGEFLPLAVEMREGTSSPSCSRGVQGLPRKNFRKMDANGAFWAHFWPIARWTLPHIEPKSGGFYPLAVRMGVSGSPRDNFWKKRICKWCLMSPFCRLLVNIFSNFATTPRMYNVRDEGVFSPLNIYRERIISSLKGGGSSPVGFFFVKRMQMMHSESIPSRLVLVFSWIFTFFVMKAPMWRVCDSGVFPRYTGDYTRGAFFSSPEPKAQVNYCHSAPSVVRPSVNFHIFNFSSRTAWWILMKLGRDELLMVPYKCFVFQTDPPRGGSRAGQK